MVLGLLLVARAVWKRPHATPEAREFLHSRGLTPQTKPQAYILETDGAES